jgi:signal transduction histidine kinase
MRPPALHRRLEALLAIGQEISSTLKLEEVLRRVARCACRLMDAKVASLMLIDKDGGKLRVVATHGASTEYLAQPNREIASTLIGEAVKSGRPLYIEDVRRDPRYQASELARREGLCSLLSVPLRTKSAVIGLLNIYTNKKHRFSEEDIRPLTLLASQSAIAIENANLHHEEMEARERLQQSEKLAALGRLSAGLAHELRNPLNTVIMLIYAMASEVPPGSPFHDDLEIVQKELARIKLLMDQFLDFARPRPPQFQRERLEEIMEETLLLIGPEAKKHEVVLYKEWSKELPRVWVDGAQIKQVFLNILLNALQAMPNGGQLRVRIRASGGSLLTTIQDEGKGIPPEIQENLFEPFFTTKQGGTGLGLSISQRIIEVHNGQLRVRSEEGVGTTVEIWLPL